MPTRPRSSAFKAQDFLFLTAALLSTTQVMPAAHRARRGRSLQKTLCLNSENANLRVETAAPRPIAHKIKNALNIGPYRSFVTTCGFLRTAGMVLAVLINIFYLRNPCSVRG